MKASSTKAVSSKSPQVADHFVGRTPAVRATYAKLLAAARKLGPVSEEAKKTSIHLVRKTAFAGVATRTEALILTLKSAEDLTSERIFKREQASASRWHLQVRLESANQVDRELVSWLKSAYELSA